MGKGNRNKLDRAQMQIDSPEAYLAERRKLNKNKKKQGTGVAITCIVLVAVIVLSILMGALSGLGIFARMTNSLKTENFKVTESMMQFYYNEYIMNWVNTGSNQLYIMYGMVNFTSDLRDQKCTLIENGTWYDYFMDASIENAIMYLEYAEGAKAVGLSLTDEDYAEIDELVDSIKKTLKQSGETIADRYGESVSANDIRKCYELIQLASKFNDYKMEILEKEIRDNGERIELYPENHKEDFYTAKYMSYTITVRSDDAKFAGNDAALEAAKADAKAKAEIIASAKDADSFFKEIQNYIETVEKAEKEESTTTGKELQSTTGTGTTAAATTTKEPTKEDYEHEISYATSSELEKWIFVENASENDCKVITEESTTTTKDSTGATKKVNIYKYTAYLVIKTPSLNKDLTGNIGYIITTDKTVAEEIRNAFLSGTDKTSEALEKLGQNKNKELSVSGSTVQLGSGSSKNAQMDAFASAYSEFDAWLNDEARKAGDLSEVITIKPTKDGATTYYVVGYFEDWSDPVWLAQAVGSLVSEEMEEWYKGVDGNGGQLALTPVTSKAHSLKGVKTSAYLFNLSYSMMYYGSSN